MPSELSGSPYQTLAATVPFDDRMNQKATMDDLDLGLIRSYLKQVKSDLFQESAGMDFTRLCRQMNIVDGPDESVRPKNVGLMFFNEAPSRFFPQTQIDVVNFPEGAGADSFTERLCCMNRANSLSSGTRTSDNTHFCQASGSESLSAVYIMVFSGA